MPRALLSVYDKTGLTEFASALLELGWDLVASGGTEKHLRDAGLAVTSVEQITGSPEMLGGRVKTLHPAIHGAILARNTTADLDDLRRMGYAPITLVVSNLYPFQETISKPGISLQDAIEQIDIGGVALLRAAAKNFLFVTVASSPSDYPRIVDSLESGTEVDIALRRELAAKAFAHTRDYDTAIHAFLSQGFAPSLESDSLPKHLSVGMQQVGALRYGENPHQNAGYYSRQATGGPLGGQILGGKALSYNNILDLDAAWRAVGSFSEPTVVIVKHLTPCGVACADTVAAALAPAMASDPVSAFGGVIAANRPIDEDFVAQLGSLFVEAIAAPEFTAGAQELLSSKRKNCRLLQVPRPFDGQELEIRSVHGGMLVQRVDVGDPSGTTTRTVSKRAPTQEEFDALMFAWKVAQHVKSNAIVLATAHATVGIGGGLPSRVDAVNIAVQKAGDQAAGAVLASDAFFPFADGVEAAVKAGVTAIIQPGGSIRDNDAIAAADAANVAMVFTGVRHFRH